MKRLIGIALFVALSTASHAQQGIIPCAPFTVSVTTSTSNPVQLSNCGGAGGVALVWNITSQEIFYNYGSNPNVAATTSNYSIPGNSFEVIWVGTTAPYFAAITASSTSTIRITVGAAPK